MPSVLRPVLLVFLDPKVKATNSPENAVYRGQINGQARAQACQEWLSEVHLECLGASVERPVL